MAFWKTEVPDTNFTIKVSPSNISRSCQSAKEHHLWNNSLALLGDVWFLLVISKVKLSTFFVK